MNRIYLAEEQELYCSISGIDGTNGNMGNYQLPDVDNTKGKGKPGDVNKNDGVPPATTPNPAPEGVELPRPRTTSGVDALMADIAVAIAKLQTEMRKENREQAMKETEHMINEMNTQADEIKSKATAAFVGGLVGGILTIGAGCLTLAGSVKAMNGLTKNLADGMPLNQALGVMENTSQFYGSLGKIAEGLGTAGSSIANYVAGGYEADIKRSEGRQQWYQNSVENLKSYAESCKELADRAMNTAETILQSSNQARQRILG